MNEINFEGYKISYHYFNEDKCAVNFSIFDVLADELFIRGVVRFDGCSNWDFHPVDNECLMHFCSVNKAVGLGNLMKKMYEIAGEMMPGADVDKPY